MNFYGTTIIICIIILVSLAFLAGVAFLWLFQSFRKMVKEVSELKEILAGKRHTHSTTEGIEDAYMVLRRIINEESEQAEIRAFWLNKIDKTLHIVRQGPNAYDGETPAGRRPQI